MHDCAGKRITVSKSCLAQLTLVVAAVTAMNAHGSDDGPLLRQDFLNLLQPSNLAVSAAALGAAGIAHRWDDELAGEVGDGRGLRAVLDLGNIYGSSKISLAATSGLWGAAMVLAKPRAEAVFSDMVRAIILANVVVTPIKFLAQRERPDGSNNLSFPSGHSATAFAMTAVLARRYGAKLAVPLYVFTAMVPVARIDHGRHFFSDVVAGSIFGTAAGYAVTLERLEGKRLVTVRPRYRGSSFSIAAVLQY